MAEHAERSHATWSASATERNWNCAGALALTQDLPETTSEAADWGTAAHQLSEKCFATGSDASDFLGTTEKGKKYEFEVDDEMAETAQTYVDYCRGRQAEYKTATGKNAIIFVEERFSLMGLNPPFDAGGTSDFVLWFPEWEMIEVVDLKGGRGVVVEVRGNKQAITYGLGVVLKHQNYKPKTVKVTIVQPRAPHKDGRVRSDEFTTGDLIEWTSELLERMHMSKEALDAKATMPPATWAVKYLAPGNWCGKTFCKAAGFCPALEQRALDAAGVWFDDLDQPRISNSPDAMSPEKLAQTLDMLDMLTDWVNAVRAYAHGQAESGVAIPGYQLVEKIGNRAWKADDPEIVAALEAKGIPHQHLWQEPKLKSPAMIEKTIGAKRKGEIADLVERPVRGTNLVSSANTTRPAATPSVHKHLSPVGETPTNLFD